MGFLGDLINRPESAIETIKEKKNKKWTIVLFVVCGSLLLMNYYLSHFTGGFPEVVIFILILAVVGIIVEFSFVLGFTVDLYVFLKLTKYKPAGEASKTIAWCFLIPTLIYHSCLFILNLILINIGRIEWTGYIYDTTKWLLYIWFIGLAIVAITQYETEHKIRNVLGLLGMFSINYFVWVYLNMRLFHLLWTTLI